MTERILEVDDLRITFATEDGDVRAVNGLTFHVDRGETLGVVGESGSGKSVTQLGLMGLLPMPPGRFDGGTAKFNGKDLLKMDPETLRKLRGNRVAMIFQDPMTSLNPFLRIEKQLTEVLDVHTSKSKEEKLARAVDLLEKVGISDAKARIRSYPHEFSGGMRQRVMIAMALLCDPELLIADEPTTALDVTIQAQILELMKELKRDFGTSIILITHDLGVVAGMADRIMVMYGGRQFELAKTADLFARPANPYTLGLLKSIPRLDQRHEKLEPIPGQPPDLARLPPGCPFRERCPYAVSKCAEEEAPLVEVAEGHFSRCHRAKEVYNEEVGEGDA